MSAITVSLDALNGKNGFILDGTELDRDIGGIVRGIGDINGDGFKDIIIGTGSPQDPSEVETKSYVVFGRDEFDLSLDLTSLDGSNGFEINATSFSGSRLGDINKDGIEDLIVQNDGSSYVIFGKTNAFDSNFDLNSLDGRNGFVVEGAEQLDNIGDINADNLDDIMVDGRYIIFGHSDGFNPSFDLSTLDGNNGFTPTRDVSVYNRIIVSSTVDVAGDINGDGVDDLIVTQISDSRVINFAYADVFVIFGSHEVGHDGSLDLELLDGYDGFRIDERDEVIDVSSAGDIDGDGFHDLIIGDGFQLRYKYSGGGVYAFPEPGISYIIFGNTSEKIRERLFGFPNSQKKSLSFDSVNPFDRPPVLLFEAGQEGDLLGISVDDVGDINGDGWDDVIIGAPEQSDIFEEMDAAKNIISSVYPLSHPEAGSGKVYIIFGNNEGFPPEYQASTLDGNKGFALSGVNIGDRTGYDVNGVGDINGDGLNDVIIGAPGANQGYVLFGNESLQTPQVDLNGTDVDGVETSTTFVSRRGPVTVASQVTLSTPSTVVSQALVKLSNFPDGAREILATDVTGTNVTADYNSETGVLTLNGTDTEENYQQVLQKVTYFNSSGIPDTSDRAIAITVVDEKSLFSNATATSIVKVTSNLLLSEASVSLTTLDSNNGLTINGIGNRDRSGFSVSSAGDFNGDGFDDVIIGAPGLSEAHIVFGSSQIRQNSAINLANLSENIGLTLEGGNKAGFTVSCIGDINNDDIDDIIVRLGRSIDDQDISYVVFGSEDVNRESLNLSDINGTNGFLIKENFNDPFGDDRGSSGKHRGSSGKLGDINGDDIDDIGIFIQKSVSQDSETVEERGIFIVFGGDNIGESGELSYSDVNSVNGFFISGDHSSLTELGDFNGDGIDDIAIGDFELRDSTSNPFGVTYARSHVIYGTREDFPPELNLEDLDGSNGFTLPHPSIDGIAGNVVHDAGDFNGDGLNDLIANNRYVVFGRADGFDVNLDLSALEISDGFRITGSRRISTIRSAGDINGDGTSDLIVSGSERPTNPFANSIKRVYVIFGGSNATPLNGVLDVNELNGRNGFAFERVGRPNDIYASSVNSAGDIDGDGLDDIIIGTPTPIATVAGDKSYSYVVYGNTAPLLDINGSEVDAGDRLIIAQPSRPIALFDASYLTLSDINSPDLNAATVILDNRPDGEAETLAADTQNTNISATYDPDTGVLALSGRDSFDHYRAVLVSLTYSNSAVTPDLAERTLQIVVDDGEVHSNKSDIATVTLQFESSSPVTIPDQAPQAYSIFTLNTSSFFTQNSDSDVLRYRAHLVDGSPLPEWLDFNPATGHFSGLPTNDNAGSTLSLVIAADEGDVATTTVFDIEVEATSRDRSNRVDGTAEANAIAGTAQNDALYGLAGSDSLRGDDGDDLLDGGSNDDWLAGTRDRDTLVGGEGADELHGNSGNDLLSGETAGDRLTGYSGRDTLVGGSGDDTLLGGSGGDELWGGSGRDILHGDSGGDTLRGGAGSDVLRGGTGRDRFTIELSEGTDTILDFEDGRDLFVLGSGLTFDDLTISGNEAAYIFGNGAELLMVVSGITASNITADDFAGLLA